MERIKPSILRHLALSLTIVSALGGCTPVEILASGISDGTKYVIDKTIGPAQPTGSPASTSVQSGPAPVETGSGSSVPPVTAAPTRKIIKSEPLPP